MSNVKLNVRILWGDNKHNDRDMLRHLFCGGSAYCMRSKMMIVAPTLNELPPGFYRVEPEHATRI